MRFDAPTVEQVIEAAKEAGFIDGDTGNATKNKVINFTDDEGRHAALVLNKKDYGYATVIRYDGEGHPESVSWASIYHLNDSEGFFRAEAVVIRSGNEEEVIAQMLRQKMQSVMENAMKEAMAKRAA